MLAPYARPLFLVCAGLFAFQSASQAQVSFYGAPPPSDVSQGIGGNETESQGAGDFDLGIFSKKPFDLTFSIRQGYDSNVFTTKDNPDSSFYTNWAAGISYAFGSSRLQLATTLNGGVTYYYTRPGDKVDFNGSFGLSATYLATPRLTITAATTTAYLSQPDLTIVGGTNRQDGDYLFTNTSLAGTYQWSEIISTTTSYNFTALYYLENQLNDEMGYISQTIGQSINWLWKPKTTLIAEYRINPITYYEADLDQLGNYFLVGFDQIFNPKFTWNVRVGAQVNFNNNPVDGSSTYVGPYGESTLRYQFLPASSLGWNIRYGTETSGLYNVSQRQTFRTGFYVNHAFTSRISANLGLNYQCNYYDQQDVIPSFVENIVDITASVSYKLTSYASLQAGYQFTVDVAPDAPEREYTRNIAFVGANFGF